MNEIPRRQNEEESLKLLRAQRRVYTRAKLTLTLQITLTVLLPVSAAIVVIFVPGLKALTAAVAFCAVVVDVAVLDRRQQDVKRLAARIQEVFDCSVLRIPWDQFTVGEKPEPERVYEAAVEHGKSDDGRLRDWYPPIVGEVPEYMGRIICQRTNLVYDARLRRHVGNWVLSLVLSMSAILFVVGVALRLPLDVLMLTVIAPAVPVITWGVREYYRQQDAADSSDHLRKHAQGLWDGATEGRCSEVDCARQSRLLQNAIFERRSSAPVIFDWVYNRMRPLLEPQMEAGAEDMVRTLQARQ